MVNNGIKKTDWLKVKQFCEDRLAQLRTQNDLNLDVVETAMIRGKIAFALEILNIDNTTVQIEIPNKQYLD